CSVCPRRPRTSMGRRCTGRGTKDSVDLRPRGCTRTSPTHDTGPTVMVGPYTFGLTNGTAAAAPVPRRVGTGHHRPPLPRRIHPHPRVQPRETPAHDRTDKWRVGPVPHAAPEPPRHGVTAAAR